MADPNRLFVAMLTAATAACAPGHPGSPPDPAPQGADRPAPVVQRADPAAPDDTDPATAVPTDRLLPLDAAAGRWVDSVVATLDTRERAAQLVMLWTWGRYVPVGSDAWERLRHAVEDLGVGGIITSIGPPVALADKLNRLQRLASTPLLIAADMEHGPGMRLDGGTLLPWGVDMGGGTDFPPVMAIGATGDPRLAYELGRITAAEARAVGVHMNFAPVVDVNNNPANPIINVRSYGGDPAAVAEFAVAHARGLQDHGMLATAKHFPGHGDVDRDSHVVPLILRIEADRADTVELVPYRSAIAAGVAGVMSAHIVFPALAGDSILPATLNPRMLDSLLVGELGFEGLVVTDALNMGAIVEKFGGGEAAVLALEAGADILLQPADPAVAIDAVAEAVEADRIPEARLERSVRAVLEAKARVGLHRRRTVDIAGVADVVGSPAHGEVAARVAERSITLVRDRDGLVPLTYARHRRVLLITWTDRVAPFAGRSLARALAGDLAAVEHAGLGPTPPAAPVLDSLTARAETADVVILGVDARVRAAHGPGALDPRLAEWFAAIAERRPAILVSLGNPYLLSAAPDVGTYLLGWSGEEVSQRAVAEALLGHAPITGRLPIAIPPVFERGAGLIRPSAEPAELDEAARVYLDSIGTVIRAAIREGLTPGVAVAVGTSAGPLRVRGFGRTDWDRGTVVTGSTVWDLASLTKVVGTTTAAMRLVDQGRLDLDAPVSRYLPDWPAGPARDDVTVRRLLAHTAGFVPFVRFWHSTEGALRGRDAVVGAIVDRGPDQEPGSRTVYTDLGMILLGAVIEAAADTTLDAYLEAEVFGPLGMADTGFNPRGAPGEAPPPGAVPLDRIAPTEVDTVFRDTHVHGYVHDENAYAMGGVAGHAGLFSSAHDLAAFAGTLLRSGRAEAYRLAGQGTVAAFTSHEPGAERALGWDAAAGTRIARPFSDRAFGQTGFTGTSLWIDPARDLYVVLLTSYVNPTRGKGGLNELRRRVHELAVKAVAR